MPKPYIRGRRNVACVSLDQHLASIGVKTNCVGHETIRGQATRLLVWVRHLGDVLRVPDEWDGFPVVTKFGSPA